MAATTTLREFVLHKQEDKQVDAAAHWTLGNRVRPPAGDQCDVPDAPLDETASGLHCSTILPVQIGPPILRAKLHPPDLPVDFVPRPRLLDLVSRHRNAKLTLVSAAAGYGKSSLVRHSLETCGCPSAWVSLDEDDNECRTFLTYTVAALQVMFPDALRDTAPLIEAIQLPTATVLARYVLSDLEEIGKPFVLVYDDYHHIRNRDVNEVLSAIVRYAPSGASFFVVTRRDPPLRLATLRASGALVEIGADDLRFRTDETRELLRNRIAGSFDTFAADILHERFEGWPAGLRLAALSFPTWDDVASGLGRLGHGLMHVTDFMVEEVLSRQPGTVAESLMEASILDRICAPLWDAITPSGDGRRALKLVREEHLFEVALDQQGDWIRFHHLFQKLLQDQLKRRRTQQEIAALHMRASHWLERHGDIEEAIRHALSAGDVLRAAEIVERHGHHEIDQDRWYVVQKWMDLLPENTKEQRANLLLVAGWLGYFRARYETLPPIISRIEEQAGIRALADAPQIELEFLRAVVLYFSGDVHGSIASCSLALRAQAETFQAVAGEFRFVFALTLHGTGKTQDALKFLENESNKAVFRGVLFRARLDAAMACVHILSGNANETIGASKKFLMLIGAETRGYVSLWAHFLSGIGYLQTLQLHDAGMAFDLARENRDYGEPRLALDALIGLALTHQLLLNSDQAVRASEDLTAYVYEKGDPQAIAVAESFLARLAVLRGDLVYAEKWAASVEPPLDPPGMFFWLEQPALTKARIQIAQGNPGSLEGALHTLGALRPEVERLNLACQRIEIETLQSLALDKLGRAKEAQAMLLHAAALAERGAWMRPFVELGIPMLGLLERVAASHVSPILDRITEVVRSCCDRIPASPADVSQNNGDRLTTREHEVLTLLAAGLSNRAIAEKLFISPETVKKRLYNTYQKLHVHSRTAALSRAKVLGILSGS